jgi:tRNA pseudouridine55 synthase
VYRFEELWRDDDRAGLEIECSSGTYVRQLVADLGDAYCEELERTAIGPFKLEDSDAQKLIPMNEALSFLPEQKLTDEEASRVSHGMTVDSRLSTVDSHVRLTHGRALIAIAEPRDDKLRPRIVFPSE